MPNTINENRPPSDRDNLPPRAQEIFREAFNHAYAEHDHDPRQEENAFRIAWAAVKQRYEKTRAGWVAKG